MHARVPLLVIALVCSLVAACGEVDPEADTAPTWHRDVRPILEARCVACHQSGGIGPVPLDSYEDAAAVKDLVATVTAARTMPPWLARPDCRTYVDDPTLSDDQIAVLAEWAELDAPEGDPADFAPLDVAAPAEAEDALLFDATLSMPAAYTPPADTGDDYRCFLIDWPETTTKYVTGFSTRPGDARIVHHVIAYLIPPESVAEVRALDDGEPGLGYTCYGGPGTNDTLWLGAWAPGGRETRYPNGTGLRVEPGSVVALQVHYNTRLGAYPDLTAVDIALADSVEREGFIFPFTNPSWLDGANMMIPAGDPEVVHTFDVDLGLIADERFLVYSANLHMHELGKNGAMWLERDDGARECLLDIPRWDFHWQITYGFDAPLEVGPGDKLFLECRWDNSEDNQPIVDGARREPQDTWWGDGTTDEMCLGVFYVSER